MCVLIINLSALNVLNQICIISFFFLLNFLPYISEFYWTIPIDLLTALVKCAVLNLALCFPSVQERISKDLIRQRSLALLPCLTITSKNFPPCHQRTLSSTSWRPSTGQANGCRSPVCEINFSRKEISKIGLDLSTIKKQLTVKIYKVVEKTWVWHWAASGD